MNWIKTEILLNKRNNWKNIPLVCDQIGSLWITSWFVVIRIWRRIEDAPCLVSIFWPAAQHEPTAPNITSDSPGRFALTPPTFWGRLRGTSDRCIISVKWVWLIYCSNEIVKISNCIYGCVIVVLWCLYSLWYTFASVNDPFFFFCKWSRLFVDWLSSASIRSIDPSFHWLNFLNAKSKCIDHFSRIKYSALVCEYLF